MASTNLTVYLIEDSPVLLELLREAVESSGATVVGSADTASKAIADIAAAQPDAVTIDIGLKKGNGFDVLEAIAIAYEKPPLRIVLTNYVTDAYREAARRLGAEYFFDKAKQFRDLVDVLASYKTWRASPA